MLFAILVLLLASSPASDRLADEITGVTAGGAGPGAAPSSGGTDPVQLARLDRCPWLQTAMAHHQSPAALADLVVRRMTLFEKLGEIDLIQTDIRENIDSGVRRLCIPPLTLQDGPQGVSFGAGNVTQLPAPVGLGATFDTAMARSYGKVMGSEALGQGIDVIQGPNLNVARVPEAGRAWESFGEDPLLVSAMGVGEIEGIQSTGAMAMAKHFAVYTQETNRSSLNDLVSQRTLEEIYLPPFKAAVTQAHVSSIMCAYPEVNGTYQCQSAQLLGLLRTWGFTGFVRSDLGAVHDPVAALSAGTDLIKPLDVSQLAALVQQHQLPMSVVDTAVTQVLTEMFAHGLVGGKASGTAGRSGGHHGAHELCPVLRRACRGAVEGHRLGASPARSPSPVGGRHRGRRLNRSGDHRLRQLTGGPDIHIHAPERHPSTGRCRCLGHLFQRREHHRKPSAPSHRPAHSGIGRRPWAHPHLDQGRPGLHPAACCRQTTARRRAACGRNSPRCRHAVGGHSTLGCGGHVRGDGEVQSCGEL